MGQASTLYVYCPEELLWKPTEEQLVNIVDRYAHFGYCGLAVDNYSEDDTLEFEGLLFIENVHKDGIFKYYRKYASNTLFVNFTECYVESQIVDVMDSISESIKGNWVPWSVSMTLGRRPIPDVYAMSVEFVCNFCITIHGDGIPKEVEKCREVLSASAQVQEICSFLETLNSKKWTTHISCSF